MDTTAKKNADLSIHLGRPSHGSLSSFDKVIKDKLLNLRGEHEQWGAQTLYVELQNDPTLKGVTLPKPSTIHHFLVSQGLTKVYQKHRPMPTEGLYTPTDCHEIWQVDGKGNQQVADLETIAWLNVKDICSHIYISSFPALLKSPKHHPTTSDYQCALRLGFYEWGLPQKVQCDHASVFYDNKSKSPFPTMLHLWLLALGIELIYSRVHRATDQGQVERSHRTLTAQISGEQVFTAWKSLYDFAQTRRKRLNELLPCQSLNGQAPLVAYPQARHSGRYYHPVQEEQLLEIERIYQFLEKGEWFRIVSSAKTLCLGGQVYYLNQAIPKQELRIKFDAAKQQLIFYNDKEQIIQHKAIKGIDKELMMGQHFKVFLMTACQLELPFDWEHQKVSTTFLNTLSTT